MIAKALIAARSAGWNVPFYTPPPAQDPVVRQKLADHPDWVDGLTFASGRYDRRGRPRPFYVPAEVPRPVRRREGRREDERRATRSSSRPEYAMYAYDFVRVLVAAIQAAGTDDRAKLLEALNEVTSRARTATSGASTRRTTRA